MTRFSRRWLAAGVLAGALASSSFASAASPTPADLESARALYVTGKELRDAGSLPASLEKFKAAYALVPTPITALEVAEGYLLTGKPLEARQVALSVERLPVLPDESKKAAAARVEARELGERLSDLIPSLLISVSNAPATDVQVLIDGELVPVEALSVPRKVNPGKHVIVARTETGETRVTVDLPEREVRRVPLDLQRATPLEPRAAPPVEAPPAAPSSAPSRSPWLTVSLLVAGGAAVVGASTGAVAWAMSSDLREACVGTQCPPGAHDDLSTVRTTATISTIAFAVAGAGALTALTLWWLAPSPSRSPASRPATAMRASLAGIEGTFP